MMIKMPVLSFLLALTSSQSSFGFTCKLPKNLLLENIRRSLSTSSTSIADNDNKPKTTSTSSSPSSYSSSSSFSSSSSPKPFPSPHRFKTYPNKPNILLLDTPETINTYINGLNIDTVMLDCDGVLYRGSSINPFSSATIKYLQSLNKRILFVTNTSSRSRLMMKESLEKKLNMELSLNQMVPSSWSCAQYIKLKLPHIKKVYVVGEKGLVDELNLAGIDCVQASPFSISDASNDDASSPHLQNSFSEKNITQTWSESPGVDAVICGASHDFNYKMLAEATMYLQNKNVVFISTNNDAFDVIEGGRHQPENGALVSAIEFASKRKATLTGKPSTFLWDIMKEEFGLSSKKCMIIGDRMDTDIKFGMSNGMKTALVFTGCTSKERFGDHDECEEEPLPDVVMDDISVFLKEKVEGVEDWK